MGQLHAAGIDLDTQDNAGITAVMCACANSHNTTLAILLRKGKVKNLVTSSPKYESLEVQYSYEVSYKIS